MPSVIAGKAVQAVEQENLIGVELDGLGADDGGLP